MKSLLTAFINTSSEVLLKNIYGFDLLLFENDKAVSVHQLEKALQTANYRYIFSFGQRPLIKNKIHIENKAIIGGEMLDTSFDTARLKGAFEDCGTTVKLSYNAGTSYCNNIYFHGIKMISKKCLNTEMVFIHIPYIKNISCSADFFKSIENGINKFLSEAV